MNQTLCFSHHREMISLHLTMNSVNFHNLLSKLAFPNEIHPFSNSFKMLGLLGYQVEM